MIEIRAEVGRVTGAGENWLNDGLDVDGVDSGLWAPGVDYVAGWREARETADRLNRALLGAGFELSVMRAAASTSEDGRGVVRMADRPDAVDRLAGLLEAMAGGGDGAA